MRRARRQSDDALVGEVCRRIPTVPNHKGVGDFAYFWTGWLSMSADDGPFRRLMADRGVSSGNVWDNAAM
jgi:hypothetical protein